MTGGRTNISLIADHIVSNLDNNVQVHLPNDSISTHIESLALDLVLDLLSIPRSTYPSKTITTGATASNILGLALGRQAVISRIKSATCSSSSHQESSLSTTKDRDVHYSVAEDGFGGVEIDILCAGAHASIRKAASIVGIGRSKVIEVVKTFDNESNTADQDEGRDLVAFDLVELENRMKIARDQGRGIIVCPAYGEVNTGAFTPDMPVIRRLCDEYGAWLHLDAAFGGFGVLHPDFKDELQEGLALADSLTLDGHKWLNVPYDCGLFYTRSELVHQAVCGPGLQAPAYLSTFSSTSSVIPSPLNVRLENSSRFRALPLYASLVCYGKEGYASIIRRNISFARSIEECLRQNENYDVLTPEPSSRNNASFRMLNIVLFAPSSTCPIKEMRDSENGGNEMTLRINKTGEMYVTATKWKGRSAARLAVSNHLTGTDEGDFQIVVRRLKEIMEISPTV